MSYAIKLFATTFVFLSGCKPSSSETAETEVSARKESAVTCPVGIIEKSASELKDWWPDSPRLRKYWPGNAPVDTMCRTTHSEFHKSPLSATELEKELWSMPQTKIGYEVDTIGKCFDWYLSKEASSKARTNFDSLSAVEKERFKRGIIADVYYTKIVLGDAAAGFIELITGINSILGDRAIEAGLRKELGTDLEKILPKSMNWLSSLEKCKKVPGGVEKLLAQSEYVLTMLILNKVTLTSVRERWTDYLNKLQFHLRPTRSPDTKALEEQAPALLQDAPWFTEEKFKAKYLTFYTFDSTYPSIDGRPHREWPSWYRYKPGGGTAWFKHASGGWPVKESDEVLFRSLPKEPKKLLAAVQSHVSSVIGSNEFRLELIEYLKDLRSRYLLKLKKVANAARCLHMRNMNECIADKTEEKNFINTIEELPDFVFNMETELGTRAFADSRQKFEERWRKAAPGEKEQKEDIAVKIRLHQIDSELSSAMCRLGVRKANQITNETKVEIAKMFVLGTVTGVLGLVTAELQAAVQATRALRVLSKAEIPGVPFSSALLDSPSLAGILQAREMALMKKLWATSGSLFAVDTLWATSDLKHLKAECHDLIHGKFKVVEENMRDAIFRPFSPVNPTCLDGSDQLTDESKLTATMRRPISAIPLFLQDQCYLMVGLSVGLGTFGMADELRPLLKSSIYLKNQVMAKKLLR